ncbi:MAG: hypothetical protein WAM17_15210 [Rhodoplanes sp.]
MMTTLASERSDEPWRRRLYLPNYQIGEAARYVDISPQTVAAWHHATLSRKEKREELSYMQLIEVAVVAAFRRAGIRLREIRAARDYVQKELKGTSIYPISRARLSG